MRKASHVPQGEHGYPRGTRLAKGTHAIDMRALKNGCQEGSATCN
jgi:hypothetical protein